MRKIRVVSWVLGSLLLLAGVAVATLYFILRASLPALEGETTSPDLQSQVSIERDALGIPTLRAGNRNDLAWATGYVHGQDRFFQMDLSRRLAAGELAELFGTVALSNDREMRVHRFRSIARQVLDLATPGDRALLEHYAQGVNAGVASLASRPFEYWLLRSEPAAWRAEDSVLVVFAMYVDLTYSGFEIEESRGRIHDALPEGLYRFLYSSGTEWDAPLIGAAFAVDPVPAPAVYDLRHAAPLHSVTRRDADLDTESAVGSNNWAVAGSHTASGAALIANDMHLGLNVPATWYRARLQVGEQNGSPPSIDLNGVTLPGAPSLVVGSNASIAWAFTNSYGDWTDLVVVDVDSATPDRYATADGPTPFETVVEKIHVRGAADDVLEVKETRWGPVVGADARGRPLAAAWTAHDPAATNFGALRLESARDVAAALDIAARTGIPPQNFVVADAQGSIGWTIMGRIPRRAGYDPRVPSTRTAAGAGWQGWLAPEEYPRIVNPPQGRIWTANARVVDGPALDLIGDGGYALGARAGQIRDDLLRIESATPKDMLGIQLDDRVRLYDRWRARLLERLDSAAVAGNPERAEARRLLAAWNGHAGADSAGFRILRAWRDRIRTQVFAWLVRDVPGAAAEDPKLRPPGQFEGPLWELVRAEPAHLLDAQYENWRGFELAKLDEVVADLLQQCDSLSACTWGKYNQVRIRHPLSRAVPLLSSLLDMPAPELPGDTAGPRVQTPTFGQSERLSVSPGRESEGYMHVPGGQSGHPLSPYYRAGFEAWAEGRPLPFLPGPPQHRLIFHPAPASRQ